MLSASTELGQDDIEAALGVLERQRLVQRQGMLSSRSIVFRHALTEDAVYSTLTAAGRRTVHQAVCGGLESGAGPRPQDEPELFAYHHERAHYSDSAVSYWKAAGHRAAKLSAHDVACRNFERALDLLPAFDDEARRNDEEHDIRQGYGLSLAVTTGMASRAMEANAARLEQLREESAIASEWPVLFQEWAMAWLQVRLDRMVALQGLLQGRVESMEDADPERPVLEYLITSARGLTLFYTGRLQSCVDLLTMARGMREAILPAFEKSPDRSGLTTPTSYAATSYALSGHYAVGKQLIEDDLEWFEDDGPEYLLVCAVGANASLIAGDHEYAYTLAGRAASADPNRIVANGREWARVFALVARSHIDVEQKADGQTIAGDLSDLSTQLDVVFQTEIRAGILMQYMLAAQVADRVYREVSLQANHAQALELYKKSVDMIDRLLQEPNTIHGHGHMIDRLHEVRAAYYELTGRSAAADDARSLAGAASARIERVVLPVEGE